MAVLIEYIHLVATRSEINATWPEGEFEGQRRRRHRATRIRLDDNFNAQLPANVAGDSAGAALRRIS